MNKVKMIIICNLAAAIILALGGVLYFVKGDAVFGWLFIAMSVFQLILMAINTKNYNDARKNM